MPRGRPPEAFSFGYSDLAKLTGLPEDVVRQHRKRKKLDPENLESILLYMAAHAKTEIRIELVKSALEPPERRSKSKRKQKRH